MGGRVGRDVTRARDLLVRQAGFAWKRGSISFDREATNHAKTSLTSSMCPIGAPGK